MANKSENSGVPQSFDGQSKVVRSAYMTEAWEPHRFTGLGGILSFTREDANSLSWGQLAVTKTCLSMLRKPGMIREAGQSSLYTGLLQLIQTKAAFSSLHVSAFPLGWDKSNVKRILNHSHLVTPRYYF